MAEPQEPGDFWGAPDFGAHDPRISVRLWPPELYRGGPAEGFLVRLHWGVVEGRFDVVGVMIRTARRQWPPGTDPETHPGDIVTGGRPLGVAALRTIPLGAIIDQDRLEMIYRAIAALHPSYPRGPLDPFSREHYEVRLRQLRGGRHRYDLDHYHRVAEVYDEAARYGDPHPTAHVARELRFESRSTAAKHVMTARKLGLLPPTEARQARGNTEAT